MKKTFIIDTQDKRNVYVFENLKKLGYKTFEINQSIDFLDNDLIYVLSPKFSISTDAIKNFQQGSIVYHFNKQQEAQLLLQAKNLNGVCIMNDEIFVAKNSLLTAEGALAFAITETETSISQQSIAILGFGRLGKALSAVFGKFCSNITVFDIDENAISQAPYFNATGKKFESENFNFEKYDLIINTIPKKLFNTNITLSAKTVIIELATKIYPFDYIQLEQSGIKYKILPSLPSITSPVSAGKLLLETILK